jgi:hypothetical protein
MKTKVIDFIELYNSILYNTNDLTIMYDKKSTNRSFEVYITGHYLELYRPISVHTLGLINNFNINFKVLADKEVREDFAKDLKYLIDALKLKESMGFDKVSHIISAFMYILDNIELFASYLDSEIISNE